MKITGYAIEKLTDPFGILSGDRYEYFLDIEVPEDDELYLEKGIYIKALYVVEEGNERLVNYGLYEDTSDKYLDFELEDDELELVTTFCKEHLPTE